MKIDNFTTCTVNYNVGLSKEGKQLFVVVAKSEFTFTDEYQSTLTECEQATIWDHDDYIGDPEDSALRYENDFAPLKPRCDVLLHGSACAPTGHMVSVMDVGLQVGSINKFFKVIGERRAKKGGLGWSVSSPAPFTKQPIHYGVAFGGAYQESDDHKENFFYPVNPVGRGAIAKRTLTDELLMPNTEEAGKPIQKPATKGFTPMSFGPIARHWQPRLALAGTYDDAWIKTRKPYLPVDFNELFYQSAPQDQQMDYPKGGEQISIIGMTPNQHVNFSIPTQHLAMQIVYSTGERQTLLPQLDTIAIDTDQQTVSFLWRAHHPIAKHFTEIERCTVGVPSKGWERAQSLGKRYIPKGMPVDAFGNKTAKKTPECCGNSRCECGAS